VARALVSVAASALGQYGGYDPGQGPGISLLQLAVAAVVLAGLWKIYAKAGKPGWAALVPIYNLVVLLDMLRRPWWWILLLLVPLVNVVVLIVLANDLAKAFRKGLGYTLGLVFLGFIFIPLLGFGSDPFVGRPA
jgi:hypothetical protein